MNKRIRKKYLSNKEQNILELYRECDSAAFYKHDVSTELARSFVSIVSTPNTHSSGDLIWVSAENNKLSATAFIKS